MILKNTVTWSLWESSTRPEKSYSCLVVKAALSRKCNSRHTGLGSWEHMTYGSHRVLFHHLAQTCYACFSNGMRGVLKGDIWEQRVGTTKWTTKTNSKIGRIFLNIFFILEYSRLGASLVGQQVKNLSAMWETWVQCLGLEKPLKKGMATHYQYSCLENSMEKGTWWVTVHRVAKSRT